MAVPYQAYPNQVYSDYLDAVHDPGHALQAYDVDTVVCFRDPEGEVSSRLLQGRPEWMLVYEDDLTHVWIRRTPANEARLAHLVWPPSPYLGG